MSSDRVVVVVSLVWVGVLVAVSRRWVGDVRQYVSRLTHSYPPGSSDNVTAERHAATPGSSGLPGSQFGRSGGGAGGGGGGSW